MKPDGGSAFPESVRTTGLNGEPLAIIKNGMSLRDYFAAAALQGMLAGDESAKRELLGSRAYSHADDLLAERSK